MNIGRTFGFKEGDESDQRYASTKALALAFINGIKEARAAYKEVERLKIARLPQYSNDRQPSMRKGLNSFQFIKTNRPVGNVKVYKTPVNELPCCDCNPKGAKPCGSNDCVNRALKYECMDLIYFVHSKSITL